MRPTRREFLKKTAVLPLAGLALPVSDEEDSGHIMPVTLPKGAKITAIEFRGGLPENGAVVLHYKSEGSDDATY